jgi:serine/threonine protein kinase
MSRTIAQYEVLEKIGEGGMGEVYKARDTKLDRPVALKILPQHLVEDPERLRRFVLEARAASALNHPNIVTIYDVGEAKDRQTGTEPSNGTPVDKANIQESNSGAAERDIHYIAMEYVSGQSLAAKIHSERGDLKRLLQYFVQTAEGLAKAHSAGIIHRDLKPENVMISDDGFAKILDFGLAKLVDTPENSAAAPPGSLLEEAATAVMDRTRPGIVMGTVGYMSPEQVQGKSVDQRSDIFAIGCMLYEAAAGVKPFQGDSIIDSLHKIIYSQPAPLVDFNPSSPAELQRMIRKCIAKDPGERYQSAKDIAIDLRALIADMDSGSFVQPVSPRPSTGTPATSVGADGQQTRVHPSGATIAGARAGETQASSSPVVKPRSLPKLIAGSIAAALVAFTLLYLVIGLRHSRSRLGTEFQNRKITKLTSTGKSSLPRISPDGKYVAFIASDQGQQSILLRQVATQSNVQVVPPSDTDYMGLAFSPDGNYIYYSAMEKGNASHSLYQVASLGGAPKKVLDQVTCPISFSPDGQYFAFVRNDLLRGKSMLWKARADGTGARELTGRDIPNQFLLPSWSPDGKLIASSVMSFSGAAHMEITSVPAGGGPEKPISTKPWAEVNGLQWLTDGTGLLLTAAELSAGPQRSQIWRVSYPSGGVQPVTNDLNNYAGVSMTGDSSSLATLEFTSVSNIWTVPVSSGGSPRQLTSGSGKYAEVCSAPDGRIVYCSDAAGSSEDIWIMDADGKNQKQLTFDAGMNALPSVTQDNRHVVFTSSRVPGSYNTWMIDWDGSDPKQLTTGQGDYFPVISPDGKWLYYTVVTTNERPRIWRASADGGSPSPLIDLFTFITQVSPDGKLLACGYNDAQNATALDMHLKLGVFSAENGHLIQAISMPLGTMGHAEPGQFRWARDGKSLIYLQRAAGVSNLWIQSLGGGPPKQATNFTEGQIFDFDITADGRQFVCSRGNVTTDVILIKDTTNP